MIFIDTNVLVHLVTNSPQGLVRTIENTFSQAAPGEIVITEGVLVETCTLLQFNARFGMERSIIVASLNVIFARQAISISSTAARAFALYAKHPELDIADCLLATLGDYKSARVMTFDKGLQKILR